MTRRPPTLAPVIVAALLAASAATAAVRHAPTAAAPPRFFFAGNGRLVLHSAHLGDTLAVRYRRADGSYDPAALAQIRHFFRSREDGREAPISLRLVELLAYIQDRYQPTTMTLLSGYRSPRFNADLRAAGGRAAQTSLHTQGLAADVAFGGLDIYRLWLQLRALHTGGAGYYRSGNFLHIDTGPPRFWEETTSRVDENLSAGNARVFVRTDFDRYPHLRGAVCSLHSVTAFPLRIAPEAQLEGAAALATLRLAPIDGAPIPRRDGCFVVGAPAEADQFRVVAVHAGARARAGTEARPRVVLHTCAPRVEKTAANLLSNPIEVSAPR